MSQCVDPGLQPERTALAWSRTSLALMANALLVLRAGVQQRHHSLLAAGAGLALLAGALFLVGRHRRQQLLESGPATAAPSLMVATTIAVMVAVAVGAWGLLA